MKYSTVCFLGVINRKMIPLNKENFPKFQHKIEWKGKFPETRFENSCEVLDILHFSVNLEIPELFSSIRHFHAPVNMAMLPRQRYMMAELPLLKQCIVRFFRDTFVSTAHKMSRHPLISPNQS